MKKVLIVLAASIVLAGCISTDMGPKASTGSENAGVSAERGTGSNLVRRDLERDRAVSQAGREELERLQRPGGSSDTRGGGR